MTTIFSMKIIQEVYWSIFNSRTSFTIPKSCRPSSLHSVEKRFEVEKDVKTFNLSASGEYNIAMMSSSSLHTSCNYKSIFYETTCTVSFYLKQVFCHFEEIAILWAQNSGFCFKRSGCFVLLFHIGWSFSIKLNKNPSRRKKQEKSIVFSGTWKILVEKGKNAEKFLQNVEMEKINQ